MLCLRVAGAAPRRREEDDVGAQRGRERQEVGAQEVDAVRHAVHARVVPRQPQPRRVDVDGDDALAREGELDRCHSIA
jgi:hypothetical protein